jgi:exoribonuclease-2
VEYQEGAIIEFMDDRGRHLLAAVQRDESKQKRLRVLAEGGRELSITHKQVTLSMDRMAPLHHGQAAAVEVLNEVRQAAAAAVGKVSDDLPLLWELSLEVAAGSPQRVVPLETLCELQFGSVRKPDQLAALLLLRADALYFRQRNQGFEPRTVEQVEALRHEQVVAAQRLEARALFSQMCAQVAASPLEERASALKQASAHPQLQPLLHKLTRYVMEGDEFKDHADMDALLEQAEQGLDQPLDGRQSLRAFELLVRLGYWDRDENLFLLRSRTPSEFAADALAQSSRLSAARPETQGRADFTALTVFSIDDAETQDIDDAISLEDLGGGRVRVGVHIADPFHFVELDSPLEREARRRGATVYMPTGRIPMFPTELSEGAFSLQRGELRPALSFMVEFDGRGQLGAWRIVPSVVRVTHRLTYDEADDLLGEAEGELPEALRTLHALCDHLASERLDRGAFQIHIPDVKIYATINPGAPPTIKLARLGDSTSRDLIAELMVFSNGLAARFCVEHGIPIPFRSQEAPEVQPDDPNIMAYPEGLPRSFAMMRHMRPATTSADPRPHSSLGLDAYTQATSPIRRYVDYLTHLQIQTFLADGVPALDSRQVSERASFAESNASDVRNLSRSTERYWLMRYLQLNSDHPHTATVLSYPDAHSDKANVILNDTLLRATLSTRRRLPVGAEIPVLITRCYPRADVLNLRFIEPNDDADLHDPIS